MLSPEIAAASLSEMNRSSANGPLLYEGLA